MSVSMLAAVLDGRVVVLDLHLARVMLLDPDTERVWRACTGSTVDEIAARVGQHSSDVARTLRDLHDAGLVAVGDARWNHTPLTWI